ncbi:hypothetical protein GQR58_019446 [Nymphon striatum]|nr:hypothetical protein GQR58_019446 [Nymphon striatum]
MWPKNHRRNPLSRWDVVALAATAGASPAPSEYLKKELNGEQRSPMSASDMEMNKKTEITEKNYKHKLKAKNEKYKEAEKRVSEMQQAVKELEDIVKIRNKQVENLNLYSNRLSIKPQSVLRRLSLSSIKTINSRNGDDDDLNNNINEHALLATPVKYSTDVFNHEESETPTSSADVLSSPFPDQLYVINSQSSSFNQEKLSSIAQTVAWKTPDKLDGANSRLIESPVQITRENSSATICDQNKGELKTSQPENYSSSAAHSTEYSATNHWVEVSSPVSVNTNNSDSTCESDRNQDISSSSTQYSHRTKANTNSTMSTVLDSEIENEILSSVTPQSPNNINDFSSSITPQSLKSVSELSLSLNTQSTTTDLSSSNTPQSWRLTSCTTGTASPASTIDIEMSRQTSVNDFSSVDEKPPASDIIQCILMNDNDDQNKVTFYFAENSEEVQDEDENIKRFDDDQCNSDCSTSSNHNAKLKRKYRFSKSIENLHRGRPAHGSELNKVKKNSIAEETDSSYTFGSYSPSFASGQNKSNRRSATKINECDKDKDRAIRKASLMAELFGDNTGTTLNAHISESKNGNFESDQLPDSRIKQLPDIRQNFGHSPFAFDEVAPRSRRYGHVLGPKISERLFSGLNSKMQTDNMN